MAERKDVALLYQYSDNWIGGAYYITNIVRALSVLDDDEKPALTIFHNSPLTIHTIVELNYPYIQFILLNVRFNLIERVINRLGKELLGRLLIKKKISNSPIKFLYPVDEWVDLSNVKEFYYWIPDFQERYLPQLFSKKEIWQREAVQKVIEKNKYPVIFSSFNALDDYNKFYPQNENKKEVLKFVSIVNDDYSKLSITNLKEKFKIKGNYFISPNQFWQHKNQSVLIKAAKILKDRGIDFTIVFTGKEFDHRNPNYVSDLKAFVENNQLTENIIFLGFIDRTEQLQLMKHSIAIVQPSLFEGWSTVVEDTKALNHVIVLSDIPLHREQMTGNCVFFDPLNDAELAEKLVYAMQNSLVTVSFNNSLSRLRFAKHMVSIFNN